MGVKITQIDTGISGSSEEEKERKRSGGVTITQIGTGISGNSQEDAIFQGERAQDVQGMIRDFADVSQAVRTAEAAPTVERKAPILTAEEEAATRQALLSARARQAGNEAERSSLLGNAASPNAWMTTSPEDVSRYWQLGQENQVLGQQTSQMSTRLNRSEIAAWQDEQLKQYEGIRKSPDYAALSQPDESKAIKGLTLVRTTGPQSIYNYVNNLNGYADNMRNGPEHGGDLRRYDFLTDKERADYNYISNNQGLEAGKGFLDILSYDLNQRMTNAAVLEAQGFASRSPVAASALSVAQNPLSGAGLLSGVAQGVQKLFTGRPVDYNTAAFLPSRTTTAVREQVAADIEKAHPNATVAGVNMLSFLYQTGMSMADSGVIAAMTLLGVPGATALLGGAAGTSAALEVKERGGSDLQVLSYGLAAGFAESLFEEVSLEKLIHPKTADGLRGVLMNIVRQAFTEGSEEFTTTLANTLTDAIINGDKSELLIKQRQLMADNPGMSEEEARKQAWKDWAISLAADFLGGALSGGIMGGGSSTINFALESNLRKAGQAMRSLGVTNADVQDALLTAMNGARDAQSRAWLSDMADRAARGEDLAGKLPLADLGRVFALRADLGPNRIGEMAYATKARNASRPYLNETAAQEETPAQESVPAQETAPAVPQTLTLPTKQEAVTRQADPLGYAVGKVQRGEALSGNDARAILENPQAVQTLRDAGVLTESVRPGSEGRAQVQTAVAALADQRAQEAATAPPAAQEASAAQERAATAPAAEAAQRAAEGLTEKAANTYTEDKSGLRLPTAETGTGERTAAGSVRAELEEDLRTLETATQEQGRALLNSMYDRGGLVDELRGAGLLSDEEVQQRSQKAMLRAVFNYVRGETGNVQEQTGRQAQAADGGQQAAGQDVRSGGPGRSRTGGGSQRTNRVGTGGQSFSQRVEQIRGSWERQEGAGRIRSAVAALGSGERVSTASLGINNGTDRAAVTLLPDQMDAKTEKELASFREAQRSFAQRGISVKGFTGTLEMEGADGSVFRARGAVSGDGKTIWVRMDHPDLTWQQILAHEDFHERVKNDKQLLRDVAAAFDRDFTRAERRAIVNDYFDTYGYYNVSEDYVLEEVLADYYAGIDIYAGTENAQKDIGARSRNVQKTVGSRGEAVSEAVQAVERDGATVIPEKSTEEGAEDIADALADDDIESAIKYSYDAVASAGGFIAVEKDGERYFIDQSGERVTEVTADRVMASPIGTLLNYSVEKGWLRESEKKQQAEFFANILTLAATNQDFAMSMNLVGAVAFTAIKANSDAQYKSTFDFKSICIKTQAIINNMSAAMVARKGALTKDEIRDLYEATATDGLPVNCPECYVFSRWVGIGGLLDNIWKYQNRYGGMTEQQVVDAYNDNVAEVQRQLDEFNASVPPDKRITFGKMKSSIGQKVTKKYNDLRDRVEKADSQGTFVSDADREKLAALERMMINVKSINWIKNVYFGGKGVAVGNKNKNFAVPADILFDLNKGGDFATKYPEAWGFRTTQGAGYGKAITPYAAAVLGEGILGTTSLTTTLRDKAAGKLNNPFLGTRGELPNSLRKKLDAAVAKQKTQLFRGGQRFSSTSDMANDVASDILIAFLEMQTMHAGVQMYTKVDGAVGALSLMGAFVNQSLMPLGTGFKNGKLADTYVGGMDPEVAFKNRKKYDRAGTITIGVNDAHIRALIRQIVRDFVIPYHASGGDADLVAEMRAVNDPGEAGTRSKSTDYTRTQGEKLMTDNLLRSMGKTEEEIESIKQTRETRIDILTRRRNPNMAIVRANPILSELYDRFNGGEWDGVKLTKDEVEHFIYPNEFWDTTVDYEHSGRNTQLYLDYCESLGFLHRFSGQIQQAKGDVTVLKPVNGYNEHGEQAPLTDLAYVYENGEKTDKIEDFFWKLLVDRRMYGNDGKYIPQGAISLSSITTGDIVDFAKNNVGRQYDDAKSQALAKKIREVFDRYGDDSAAVSREVLKLIEENKQAGKASAEPRTVSEANEKYSREVNSITYFSGGGLVDHALRDVIGSSMAVEYDKGAAAVYALNNGDVFVGDVRDFSKNELDKMKDIDYFHASPVCKNYSRMNTRRTDASDSNTDITTAQATADAIRRLMPKVFTLEQVPGYKGSKAYNIIADTLTELGYAWDDTVAKASDYGGATSRERLMLRAVRDGALPALPKKVKGYSWFEATADLIDGLNTADRIAPFLQERINATPELQLALENQTKPILILGGTPGGKAWWASANEPSPSITTDMTDSRIIMPDGTIKKPDARFYARIMGLPDSYQFTQYRGKDNQTQGQKVIGNGVPVQLTQKFFGNLLNDVLDTGVKFSREADDTYLAAVKAGDMDTAQRMVDDAAKRAGYMVKAWHQTAKDFTVFNTNNPRAALNDSETPNGIFFKTNDHDIGLEGKKQMPMVINPGRGLHFKNREEANRWYCEHVKGYKALQDEMHAELSKYDKRLEDLDTQMFKATERTEEDRLSDEWDVIYAEMGEVENKYHGQLRELLNNYFLGKNRPYDSIHLDYDGHRYVDGKRENVETYIVFSNTQAKSADPVTYDDDGNVIPLSERFNPEKQDIRWSRETPGDTETLRAENEELKDRLAYWQSQVKLSDRTQPRDEDVRRVARDLLKTYESKADKDATAAALRELAHTVMSDEVRWTDVRDQATRLAGSILEGAERLDENTELHREIRAAIRSQKLSFSEQGNIPDYNQWRKANFGRLTISKDGVPVETRWQELQDAYGEGYFPSEITNPTDQILYLADLWDRLADAYENPYSADMAEATQYVANEIIDRVLSEEIRQAPTTFADRAKKSILRRDLRIQIIKGLLEAERERRRNQVANLKERYKAKEAKGRESRKAKELRTKIVKHAKKMTEELLHPTDKRHIPEALGKGVAAVLSVIDLGSGYSIIYDRDGNFKRVARGLELGAEETRRTQAFLAVQSALRKKAGGYVLDPTLFGTMEEPGNLTRLVTDLANIPIANMNSEELQVVYDALQGVETAVRTLNQMLSAARWAKVDEAANALWDENAGKTRPLELAGYLGRVQGLTRLDMLVPEAFFHRLGKAGQAIFKMLRGAQDTFITNMADAAEDTRKIIGDMNTGALEREQHKVTMGGEEVVMTTAQIMELYCLMQRDQGMQHIMTGGILIEPVRQGLKKTTQTDPLHPSLGELADAVKLLTAEEIRVADALQKYLSVDMAELGNEATMKVYGYKKFGQEEKYWKIRSNRNEIPQSIEEETQTTSVANRGFTKAVNPRADTSVKIGSIFDTYSQSINDMATYSAWLAVGEDVNRIRNYEWRDADGQRAGTVKGILDRVHGTGGANYLQRLLADIANGAGTDDTGLTSGFVGAYKAAAIGANIRVIIQQPTAILRALEMIDPKYMAGLRNPMKAFDRAKKYSPIAQWKDWGYFDINTGRKMKDVLFENPSKLEKVRQVSMALAGKADSFAWGILWGAVEAETKAKTDLAPGTEAFYKACAERFNDIIDHTQVVDGILQRSQIMRSKDTITRMAVSFMSEPTKQYNQFMSAVYDLRHANNRADQDAAKRQMARTVFSMLAAGLANVLAQSIVDALRDDDREKTYWEKLLQKFLGYDPKDDTFGERFKTFAFSNMGELFNPASYLPYAKDIMSIMQGYSVERMDMEGISDTIKAFTQAFKALSGDGTKTTAYTLIKLAEQASKMLGLPAYNVDRDLTALYTTIINSADMPVLQYGLERYKNKPLESGNLSAALKGILWDARKKGDGSYDIIVRKLLKDGYSQDIIDKAMLDHLADTSGFNEARKAADAEGDNNGSYTVAENLEAIRSLDIPEEDRAELLEAKLSETQRAVYDAFIDAGMTFDDYVKAWDAIAALEPRPGKATISDSQKWQAVVHTVNGQLNQDKILRAFMSDDQEAKYDTAYQAGISPAVYADYKADTGAMTAEYENGKAISGSKKAKVLDYIDGLRLPDEQKDVLYFDAGYAESKLEKDAPWHQATGGGGGSGLYAPARVPTLRLPTVAARNEDQPVRGLRLPTAR